MTTASERMGSWPLPELPRNAHSVLVEEGDGAAELYACEMPYPIEDMLVVGITSRALFDLDDEDRIFRSEGMGAYRAYQRDHEDEPLAPGTGFSLVRGLLAVNDRVQNRLVEVVVISRNDADSGIRIFNSIEHHRLDISRGAFTDGGPAAAYLRPFHGDLFLSADEDDVRAALAEGFPAALVLPPPESLDEAETIDQVRIAFDGDAVLFDAESERIFQAEGLEAFLKREAELADQPMNPGPFEPFLMALKRIQGQFDEEHSPIRTALVTARNAPAHKRVVNTLRAWGIRLDETFFLGGVQKAGVLQVLRPHIFFDDQRIHLDGVQPYIPSAHVLEASGQLQLPLSADEGRLDPPTETQPSHVPDEGVESTAEAADESLDEREAS